MLWFSGYINFPSSSATVDVYIPENTVSRNAQSLLEGFYSAVKATSFTYPDPVVFVGFYPCRPRAVVEGNFKLFPCNSNFTSTSSSWYRNGPLGYSSEGYRTYAEALAGGNFDDDELTSLTGKILYTNTDQLTFSAQDFIVPALVTPSSLGWVFNPLTDYQLLGSTVSHCTYPFTCFSAKSGSDPSYASDFVWSALFHNSDTNYRDQSQTYVHVPSNVVRIATECFNNTRCDDISFDTNLQSFYVSTIGESAFRNSHISNLHTYHWTAELYTRGMTSIGEHAFENNDFRIRLHNRTNLSSYSFAHSNGTELNLINYTGGVIPSNCFRESLFASISFPDLRYPVSSIEDYAFYSCTELVNIILLTCQNIKDSAFEGCSSLTRVIFPKDLVKIYDRAFRNCTSLSIVDFHSCVNALQIGSTVGPSGRHNVWTNCKIRYVHFSSYMLKQGYIRKYEGEPAKYMFVRGLGAYVDNVAAGIISYFYVPGVGWTGDWSVVALQPKCNTTSWKIYDLNGSSNYNPDKKSNYIRVYLPFASTTTHYYVWTLGGVLNPSAINMSPSICHEIISKQSEANYPMTTYGRYSTTSNAYGGINITYIGDVLHTTPNSDPGSTFGNLDNSAYCNDLLYSDYVASYAGGFESGVRLWDLLVPIPAWG